MSTAFCSFLPFPCGKIFYIIVYIKNDIKNYIKNSSEMAVMEGGFHRTHVKKICPISEQIFFTGLRFKNYLTLTVKYFFTSLFCESLTFTHIS